MDRGGATPIDNHKSKAIGPMVQCATRHRRVDQHRTLTAPRYVESDEPKRPAVLHTAALVRDYLRFRGLAEGSELAIRAMSHLHSFVNCRGRMCPSGGTQGRVVAHEIAREIGFDTIQVRSAEEQPEMGHSMSELIDLRSRPTTSACVNDSLLRSARATQPCRCDRTLPTLNCDAGEVRT